MDRLEEPDGRLGSRTVTLAGPEAAQPADCGSPGIELDRLTALHDDIEVQVASTGPKSRWMRSVPSGTISTPIASLCETVQISR